MEYDSESGATPAETRKLIGSSGANTEYSAIAKAERQANERAFLQAEVKAYELFTRLVTAFYSLLAVSVIVVMILGYLSFFNTFYALLAIAGLTIIGGLGGAAGVYKFGTVMHQIDRLRKENDVMEDQVDELRDCVTTLRNVVADAEGQVKDLQLNASELEQHMGEFDDLKKSLGSVENKNKNIVSLVDSLNDMYSDMEYVILSNEKAALWSKYYEVERNEEAGLSKREYDRFLSHLTKKQRARFNKLGPFTHMAGDDDVIDRIEFQKIVEKVLDQMDADLGQHIGQASG